MSTYIDFSKEINDKDRKFKTGDVVRISKCNTIFSKGYTSIWSEELFIIKKVKNTVPCTYAINDLNGEELLELFKKKNCKKQIKKSLELKKDSREKGIRCMLNGKDTIIRLIAG